MGMKKLLVGMHELCLSDSGAGLFGHEVLCPRTVQRQNALPRPTAPEETRMICMPACFNLAKEATSGSRRETQRLPSDSATTLVPSLKTMRRALRNSVARSSRSESPATGVGFSGC